MSRSKMKVVLAATSIGVAAGLLGACGPAAPDAIAPSSGGGTTSGSSQSSAPTTNQSSSSSDQTTTTSSSSSSSSAPAPAAGGAGAGGKATSTGCPLDDDPGDAKATDLATVGKYGTTITASAADFGSTTTAQITAQAPRVLPPGQYDTPAPNMHYIGIPVTVKLTAGSGYISPLNFQLFDSTGIACTSESYNSSLLTANEFDGKQVGAGQSITGTLAFQVSTAQPATGYKLYFNVDDFSSSSKDAAFVG